MASPPKLLLPRPLFGSRRYDDKPPPPLLGHPATWVPLLVGVIGAAMFLSVFFMIMTKYLRKRNFRRRSLGNLNNPIHPPILFNTQEDFIDEEQGPHLDHPIWYIRTVGLDQSVIDSIAVFKYKQGEGLVDGGDCSVCLSEFQEDEDLRLLPKCGHAFHVPCIDMWLRSHKNCPLCRAPIIRAATAAAEEPRMANSSPVDTTGEESIEEHNVTSEVEEDENSRSGETREMVTYLPNSESSEIRDVCDLRDGRQLAGDVREEVQGVRRSVSMDAATASLIYRAVESAVSCRRQRIKKGKNLSMNLNSNSRAIGSSFRLYRMMKSCSSGSSVVEDYAPMRVSALPVGRRDVPKNPNTDRTEGRSCGSIELNAVEGMEKQ